MGIVQRGRIWGLYWHCQGTSRALGRRCLPQDKLRQLEEARTELCQEILDPDGQAVAIAPGQAAVAEVLEVGHPNGSF